MFFSFPSSFYTSRLTADLASLRLTYTQTRTLESQRGTPLCPMRSQFVPKQLWSILMVHFIDIKSLLLLVVLILLVNNFFFL